MAESSRDVIANAILTHYEDHLAPEWSEHDPYVRLFFDSDCDRAPVQVELDVTAGDATYNVQITGLPKARPLHNMFAIGIKGYARTHTKVGVPVSTDIGQDFILIKSVLAAHAANTDYVKHVELRMPTVEYLLKGKFTIVIPAKGGLQMNGAALDRPKTMASQFIDATPNDIERVARPMMDYIEKTLEVRKKCMGERSETHDRVRIPAYLGGPGMEITRGIPMPAAAFILYETPKSNQAFWSNALEVVMRRDGHLLSDWSRLDVEEKAQVMKEVICYLPQALPYKSDSIDKNTRFSRYLKSLITGIEDMESALEKTDDKKKVGAGGDCEDLTQAIMMCKDALEAAVFDSRAHPALREIQELSRNYILAMTLATVTSAAVDGADDANSAVGAHMVLMMTPQWDFKEQLARVDPDLARRLPFDTRHMRRDLPVLEAEGTGIYFSRHHVDVGAQARSDLYKERCFAAMKSPIFHEFGEHSPFYREAMTILTPDFERRGSNYVGFWYRSGNDNLRGVRFEDLENKDPSAQLVPHPEIPDNVMAQMRECVKIRVPPMPLILSEMSVGNQAAHHEQAERICQTVASWGRQPAQPGQVFPAAVYTRHNLLDAKQADGIIKTLQRKAGVFKVTYSTEPLVDSESPGLQLLIYDDVSLSTPMHVYGNRY